MLNGSCSIERQSDSENTPLASLSTNAFAFSNETMQYFEGPSSVKCVVLPRQIVTC